MFCGIPRIYNKWYVLLLIVIILSIMFIPIGVKLNEGLKNKKKPQANAVGSSGAPHTRRASSTTLLITDAGPTHFEKKMRKQMKKNNGRQKFEHCKSGTHCPKGIICHTQSDCFENN